MPKTWFITGTNRGFGREFAETALERGDQVAGTSRNLDAIEDLGRRFGARFLPVELDVTDEAAASPAINAAASEFGRIDVLVNNAGYGLFGPIEEISPQQLREQFDVNVFGAFAVTRAALPIMRAQGSGHIVQISSVAGVAVLPLMGGYSASKWALEGMTEALAAEVADFGIKVTLVEPGPYGTDFGFGSAKRSASTPEYAGLYAKAATAFAGLAAASGNPKSAGRAILEVVDAEDPPLRVLFGASTIGRVKQVYADRLATWQKWEDLTVRAT